jgi:hypothetical protein
MAKATFDDTHTTPGNTQLTAVPRIMSTSKDSTSDTSSASSRAMKAMVTLR